MLITVILPRERSSTTDQDTMLTSDAERGNFQRVDPFVANNPGLPVVANNGRID